MPELELPPWLSYVTFDEEGLRTTGIVQLPLTYTGPSIPLEWPWTAAQDNSGPIQVSLLGGPGFQTLGPTTITAVRPEPTNGNENNNNNNNGSNDEEDEDDGQVSIETTNEAGEPTTVPGIVTTLPPTGDGTAPVATTTTIPATESTLDNGQTTLVPADSTTVPATTTATLPGDSATTATGFISTLPEGDTTAVFPSLSSALDSAASTAAGESKTASTDASSTSTDVASASSSTETGSGGDNHSGSSDDDDGLSGGQIAGIFVGVVTGVLLLLGLLLLCCLARRRRRRQAAGGGAYARSHSTDDPRWDRNTNPSGRHASDESDVEVDPRQLFMQPPPDYPIGPDGRHTMRDISRDDIFARYGQQRDGAPPNGGGGGFAQRLLSKPVTNHQATLGSYQTVSTSEPSWGSISSSFRGSPMPPPPPAPSNRTSVTEAEEHALPALLFGSPSQQQQSSSPSSRPTMHPFSPFSDAQPSLQHTAGTSSPPSSSAAGGAEPNSSAGGVGAFKRLSIIHSEPSLRFAEEPEQRPSKKSSDRSKGTSAASKQIGLSGLGLGALFGLVGQGRRAISLSDAEDNRGNKQSTTSDPTPVYNVPSPQLHRRHSVSSSNSSSSTDEEEGHGANNEATAFLPAGPSAYAGDPFITRWSRTTFGKKIGSSIETASQDTHSMVASILSSNRSLSSSQRRAMAVAGKRAVSEGSLGRRTQNSSDDSKKSQRSALSRHSPAYWKAQEAGVQRYSSDEKVPITDEDEEDKPSIRLVSRTQEVV